MRAFSLIFLLPALFDVATASSGSRNDGFVRPTSSVPESLRRRLVKIRDASLEETLKKGLSSRGGISEGMQSSLVGIAAFALTQKGVGELLKAAKIKFPAMLGACVSLFALLLATEAVNPSLAQSLFDGLTPGAGLLAKWLPMFFVPALTLLPLSPPIGDASEIAKLLLTTVVGFVYSLLTTGFFVLAFRKAQGNMAAGSVSKPTLSGGKPFSQGTLHFFTKVFLATGAVSIVATRTGFEYAQPLQTTFITAFTIALYVFGARLPADFVKMVHPLVTTSIGLLTMIRLLGFATDQDYKNILRAYKVGSLSPLKTGSGDIMLYLLGPSVVSFAVAMYSRRTLLKANFAVVASAVTVGSLGSLYGTAAFVRAISLGGKMGGMIRLSMLPRSVTTALAMVISSILGGDVPIAAAVVSLTGIMGATYGRTLLDAFKISDPVTRGLAIGAAGQGLGVASIAGEPDAFPFAAMAMVLCAIFSTTLVSIPAVKNSLINLAGGM